MSKSKSPFKALTSYLGPLRAPRSPSAFPRSGKATPATTMKTSASTQNLVLNNLATACRITKDVAEALNKVPYIKAVTGVVAQIIKIHEEVHGNKERCNEIISIIEKYTYTILECLAELYTAEGERRLEELKAELGSFQSHLEAILLNDLEPLKNQSRWKASVKRDKDIEDMRRIERELKGFVDRFTMKAVVVGVREAGATQPKLTEIQQTILREQWLRSQHAQYNIALVDASPGSAKRAYCAPDTRKPILDRVTAWARDRTPTSPAVFWMVGEGGAGKSTIARTIAMNLDEDDSFPTVVTFFCSRKFSDANQQVYIIPTIAYQLARLCPFYSSELLKDGSVVDSLKLVAKQMDRLLIQPWEASSSSRSLDSPPFLVIIDALDEIVSQEEGDEMSGGFMFLKKLLTAIDQGYLKGLKFFVTSRPHPDLSAVCQSLSSQAAFRLFDIPRDEVEQDIYRYLCHSLPKLQKPADHELLQLIAAKADGLFIFAATVVLIANPTPGTTMQEQRQALQEALSGLTLHNTIASPINSLYCQIIGDAFEHRNGKALSDRLDLLHTIICTEDRISIDVLVDLVSNEGDDPESILEMVEDLLQRLHAVLWVADGRITWYHASFLDFPLSPARANIALRGRTLDASCNAPSQHATLARRCFSIMRVGLKFNICQLPSSFLLDSEVEDMETRIKDHIPHILRYACRYWAIHTSKSPGHEIQEDIMRFLEENLLFWVEAMNLLQQSNLCSTLLNTVQQYAIQKYPTALDLRKNLSAASHFSTVFKGSPAAESTPHLYMSTLVYISSRFPLLQRWRTQFARLPDIYTRGFGTQLLMTFNGHTNSVNSVAFSPDGSCVVSGSYDHSVRVWNVDTGDQIKVLNGHGSDVNSVAFSPTGSRIVSGSDDHSVRVWDVETGDELKVLNGHASHVCSVAYSSDGLRIVSGSRDQSVRVWDIETGAEIRMLNGHTHDVNSVSFSSDSFRIVSGSADCSVRVWDIESAQQIKQLNGHTDWVNSVAFSPDGSRIVSGSHDHSVRVWDLETGKQIIALNGHTGDITSVTFSSDGTRAVSGARDSTVRVWDIETGDQIKNLSGHTGWVHSVAFSSDGTRVVSGSDDRSVRIWDVEAGDQVKTLNGHTKLVISVVFSPDGSCIASGSSDHSVRVWDAETGEQIQNLSGHTDWVNSVVFSPDSSCIVSGSDDSSVRVWDIVGGGQIKALNGHTQSVNSVSLSSDGSRIVSGSHDYSVRVWDFYTGDQIKALNAHGDVTSVAFSSDGTRVVAGARDSFIRVWDIETGKLINVLNGHTGDVTSIVYCPYGSYIASGSYDHSVRIWDVETGEQIKKLSGHTDWVKSIAFSSDGTRIVSASDDQSVRVWDLEIGQEITRLNGHTHSVNSVAFSFDGSHIVSGSNDRSVRVWDFKMGEEIRQIDGPAASANSITFTKARTVDAALLSPTPLPPQLNWTTNDDGWIVQSHTSDRIMWIPDNLTAYLYRPANTMIIARQTATLDLAKAEFGSKWTLCYKP